MNPGFLLPVLPCWRSVTFATSVTLWNTATQNSPRVEEVTGLGPADGRPIREEKFQPDIRQRFICFELSGQMNDSPGKFCLGTTEIHS